MVADLKENQLMSYSTQTVNTLNFLFQNVWGCWILISEVKKRAKAKSAEVLASGEVFELIQQVKQAYAEGGLEAGLGSELVNPRNSKVCSEVLLPVALITKVRVLVFLWLQILFWSPCENELRVVRSLARNV